MFAIGSPHQPNMRHTQSGHSTSDPTIALESDGANGGPNSSGHGYGHGPGVGRSPQRQQSKVRWTDSHGKDLTEVWEFEPSETGDSDDEESDSDSSQACTCVIQ